MKPPSKELTVRKSVLVHASLPHAFDVFTHWLNLWWPRSHHIGKDPEFVACLECRVGGRWFERGAHGSECDWGRVLEWAPPSRLLLSWEINAQWQHDPLIASEVEVLFHSTGDETTRVELEHRNIERHGVQAAAMRAAFDSEGGWRELLDSFAKEAEKR